MPDKDILQLIDYSLIYTDAPEDHDHYKTDGYEQCFDSYTDSYTDFNNNTNFIIFAMIYR